MITRERFMGGSQALTPGADFDIVPAGGRLVRVIASGGGFKGKLPSALTQRKGTPIAVVWNGGSNSFDIADNGNNTLVTLTAGKVALVSLLSNSSANGIWVILTQSIAAISVVAPASAVIGVIGVGPVSGIVVQPASAIIGLTVTDPTRIVWNLMQPASAVIGVVANDPINV